MPKVEICTGNAIINDSPTYPNADVLTGSARWSKSGRKDASTRLESAVRPLVKLRSEDEPLRLFGSLFSVFTLLLRYNTSCDI